MMQGNSRSKIVHYKSCHYKNRISAYNTVEINDLEQAKAMGYRTCKCCTPIAKAVKKDGKYIREFCDKQGIEYSVEDNKAYIKTHSSEWVYNITCENKVTLYHRNTCGDTNAYHKQNCRVRTFASALEYIVQHDAYRKEHPIKKYRTSFDPFYFFFGQSAQSVIANQPVKKNGNWVKIKGTKKYKKRMKKEKEQKRRQEIGRVLALIDGLSAAY